MVDLFINFPATAGTFPLSYCAMRTGFQVTPYTKWRNPFFLSYASGLQRCFSQVCSLLIYGRALLLRAVACPAGNDPHSQGHPHNKLLHLAVECSNCIIQCNVTVTKKKYLTIKRYKDFFSNLFAVLKDVLWEIMHAWSKNY